MGSGDFWGMKHQPTWRYVPSSGKDPLAYTNVFFLKSMVFPIGRDPKDDRCSCSMAIRWSDSTAKDGAMQQPQGCWCYSQPFTGSIHISWRIFAAHCHKSRMDKSAVCFFPDWLSDRQGISLKRERKKDQLQLWTLTSYNWLFQWDYTFYKWGFVSTLTDKTVFAIQNMFVRSICHMQTHQDIGPVPQSSFGRVRSTNVLVCPLVDQHGEVENRHV